MEKRKKKQEREKEKKEKKEEERKEKREEKLRDSVEKKDERTPYTLQVVPSPQAARLTTAYSSNRIPESPIVDSRRLGGVPSISLAPNYQGWLESKGSMAWSKKFFVLIGNQLYWYKNEKANELNGILKLDGCEMRARSKKPGYPVVLLEIFQLEKRQIFAKIGPNGEKLSSLGHKNYCVLRAKSPAELTEWVQHFKDVAGVRVGGNIRLSGVDAALSNWSHEDSVTEFTDQPRSEDSFESDDDAHSHFETMPDDMTEHDMVLKEIKEAMHSTTATEPGASLNLMDDTEQANFRKGYSAPNVHAIPGDASTSDFSHPHKGSYPPSLYQATLEKGHISAHAVPPSPLASFQASVNATKSYSTTTLVTGGSTATAPGYSTSTHFAHPPSHTASVPVLPISTEAPLGTSSDPTSERTRKKEGWLKLKVARDKSYNKRYFVLTEGFLSIYKNESMDEFHGLIRLEGVDVDRLEDEYVRDKKYVFEISHPAKKSIFSYAGAEAKKLGIQPGAPTSCAFFKTKTEEDLFEWSTMIANSKGGNSVPSSAGLQTALSAPLLETDGVHQPGVASGIDLNWFNILLKRHFRDMQDSKVFHNELLRKVTRKLVVIERPGWLGEIKIVEIEVGHKMIEFNNIAILPTQVPNELVGEANIDYKGGAGITLATEIYLNWPKTKLATVNILATVRLSHLAGMLYIYGPPELQSRFSISFSELPKVEFDIDIKVGDKKVLKLPRLRDFLISTFRKVLYDRMVHPNRMTFSLPFPGRKLNFKTESVTKKSSSRNRVRPAPLPTDPPEIYARKFIVTRYFDEVLNQGHIHVVEELFDKAAIVYGLDPALQGLSSGFDAIKRLAVDFKCNFKNLSFTIEDLSSESDHIICRWKAHGLQIANWWEFQPSGREAEFGGVIINKFYGEKIQDQWNYWDVTALLHHFAHTRGRHEK